ncbi:MAG: hypothetical protein ACTHKJ_00055 [Candidatus Nitrosocosmicus sp.]
MGKDKKSLAMVLPSKVVKALEINPQSIFLLLKVSGQTISSYKLLENKT